MRPHPFGTLDRRGRRRGRVALAALLTVGLTATLGTQAAAHQDPMADAVQLHKIDEELRAKAQQSTLSAGPMQVLVVVDSAPDLSAVVAQPEAVTDTLRDHARVSQRSVRQVIEGNGDTVSDSYWLKNMILAEVEPATVLELTTLDEVSRIIPNVTMSIPSQPDRELPDTAAPGIAQAPSIGAAEPADQISEPDYPWGLEKLGADHVHAELDLHGEGVRVAVLDTGVDLAHPDLIGKMATVDPDDPQHPGGWMEFTDTGQPVASEPYDSQDHGTHVSGTVLGGDASGTQIGIAPQAELMAGLVLPGGEGTLAQVVAGMQWAAAPFDADGAPAGAPADVVNMSLGTGEKADELIEPTRNLVAAGIFPSFSIGNNCFGGSSAPGNVYDAVGVGATDEADNVASFSCGETVRASDWDNPPAEWPDSYVVPDISAPGVSVLSSLPGERWGYGSGTSMAAPHVAGTVALMIEAAENPIEVDQALQTLIGTAFFDERYGPSRPNDRYGHGRIHTYQAVAELAYDSGITGTVTDAVNGHPVADATVTRADTGIETRTDETGGYELTTAPGTYGLEVDRFGYEPAQVDDIVVGEDETVPVDVELQPLPRVTVTGTVRMAEDDTTIPGATVRVLDVPATLAEDLVVTSQIGGNYTLEALPTGTHQMQAYLPGLPPSPPVTVEVTEAGTVEGVELALPRTGATEHVSLSYDGGAADDYSIVPTVSQDGRYVAFRSEASNLVPGDTNNEFDVFVRDLLTGHTERVSVASDGTEGRGSGLYLLNPEMSDDARYVVWDDEAYNLVEGDYAETQNVFIHDRHERTTEMMSVASDGSFANDGSLDPDISGDGRFVAYRSIATNLGVDPEGQWQIWVHDREQGLTELVSAAPDGSPADGYSARPSLSRDGRFIAFSSSAQNLIDDGYDGPAQIYVADRQEGTIERVSVAADGSPADAGSAYPVVSADGNLVTFHSNAQNLVDQELNTSRNVFVHDRTTGDNTLVSAATDGTPGDGMSHYPSINADGTHVSYYSVARNLVEDDTNMASDVFVHNLATGVTERTSVAADGSEAALYSQGWSLSQDAGMSAFHTPAPDLVGHQTAAEADIYVRHRHQPETSAQFAVWDLRASPESVPVGRNTLVTAWVKNVGDAVGDYPAQLWRNDQLVGEDEVRLGPGEIGLVRFHASMDQPGDGQLRIGAVTTQVTAG